MIGFPPQTEVDRTKPLTKSTNCQPMLFSWVGAPLASATVLQGGSRELTPLSSYRKAKSVFVRETHKICVLRKCQLLEKNYGFILEEWFGLGLIWFIHGKKRFISALFLPMNVRIQLGCSQKITFRLMRISLLQ